MFCPSCGNNIASDASACPACGKEISQGIQSKPKSLKRLMDIALTNPHQRAKPAFSTETNPADGNVESGSELKTVSKDKKRRPAIAFLLSLCTPGLGYIYNGNLKKGLTTWGLYAITFIAVITLGATRSFKGGVIFVAIAVFIQLGIALHAAVEARSLKAITLTRFNRWYVYAGAMLLAYFSTEFLTILSPMRSYEIGTGAMSPALEAGDHIAVDHSYYKSKDIAPGEIVIFEYPDDPNQIYIKRCVAVGNQVVEIRNGILFVNGQQTLKHVATRRAGAKGEDNYGPLRMPADSYFMLGDFRDNSLDSRHFGSVERGAIKGKVVYIYWAEDLHRVGEL